MHAKSLITSLVLLAIASTQLFVSAAPVTCPGQPGIYCDGCQCCPSGYLCPNAPASCPSSTCANGRAPTSNNSSSSTTTTSATSTSTSTTCSTTMSTTTTATISTTSTVPTNGATTTLPPVTVTNGGGGSGSTATVTVIAGSTSTTCTAPTAYEDKLVFEDNFDEFDLSKWKHDLTLGGGGNWEFEYYTNNRTNSFVRNNTLYLKPTFTSDNIGEAAMKSGGTIDLWGNVPNAVCTGNANYGCSRSSGPNYINPIQSALVRTFKSQRIRYGRVEVVAQLPKGDWIWPAIWMLPADHQYGNWPASGEIDIMESRGNGNNYTGGVQSMASTLHWGRSYFDNRYQMTSTGYTLQDGTTFADGFHTFGLFWDETGLYTYVDSDANKVLQVNFTTESFWTRGNFSSNPSDNIWQGRGNAAPFDREFYLILNVAVGGTNGYFPDGQGGKPWSDTSSSAANDFWNNGAQWQPTWSGDDVAMKVKSVKMWQKTPKC